MELANTSGNNFMQHDGKMDINLFTSGLFPTGVISQS